MLNNKVQAAKCVVDAMRRQEDSIYYTLKNYLHDESLNHDHEKEEEKKIDDDQEQQQQQTLFIVSCECRETMIDWCYQTATFCGLQNHETVVVAISCLDRFLLTAEGSIALHDFKLYQLAAMTCLYTATKLHEPKAMSPTLVSKLSCGRYTSIEIEEMEIKILMALQFRINPPTAMIFVNQFVSHLLPSHMLPRSKVLKAAIFEMTQYQTEIAIQDCSFLIIKKSIIAFAALLNSIECCVCDPVLGKRQRIYSQIGIHLSRMTDIDWCSKSFKKVQNALKLAMDEAQQVEEQQEKEVKRTRVVAAVATTEEAVLSSKSVTQKSRSGAADNSHNNVLSSSTSSSSPPKNHCSSGNSPRSLVEAGTTTAM